MRFLCSVLAMTVATSLFAGDHAPGAFQVEPETAFRLFQMRTAEGKAMHRRLVEGRYRTFVDRERIGRLLIVGATKTRKLVDENDRLLITMEAQELIELWALRYLQFGERAEAFLTAVLTGFPGDDEGPTQNPKHTIRTALKELEQKKVLPERDRCFRGETPSSEC